MNEEQIQKILNDYKKKREREIQHYHNVKKHDPIFIEKNRLRAKQYYEKNNDKYKQKYLDNRDYQIARSSFEYHKNPSFADSSRLNPISTGQLQEMVLLKRIVAI